MRLAKSFGKGPDKLFSLSSRISRVSAAESEMGNFPVRLFWESLKFLKAGIENISLGMVSERLFAERSIRVRFAKFPNSTGIAPLKLLSCNPIYRVRLERLPKVLGMLPLNWLSFKYNSIALERFPNEDGIDPVN